MKRLKRVGILIVVSMLLGILLTLSLVDKKNEKNIEISLTGPLLGNQITDLTEVANKLKMEEVVINKFSNVSELIVMETELSEIIKWDESWGSLDVFKKSQEINFYGVGLYTTDLTNLGKDDMVFNHMDKKITIKILKPRIKSIEIDESKTTYKLTETGLFRFSDVKITPAQNATITSQVKLQMRKKMNETALYNNAIIGCEVAIKELFENITVNIQSEKYKVIVEFK